MIDIAEVYSKYPVTIVDAKDCILKDKNGKEIVDFYSGHGVISIGHKNPVFIDKLESQLRSLAYYSNAVHIEQQKALAESLDQASNLKQDYSLFLCNSGAEANENALKVAALENKRSKIIAFKNGFHGRTSLAVQCTDNPKLRTTLNSGIEVDFLPLNDVSLLEAIDDKTCAVIIEGIQGIGGIHQPQADFLSALDMRCKQVGCLLILDEVQSGFGRSGRFFAFQHSDIEPDIITCAKGMGNGYPIGATLYRKDLKVKRGDLGSTFGGNPMASVAAQTVTDYIVEQALCSRAHKIGQFLLEELPKLPGVIDVRGEGLMIGFDLDISDSSAIRSHLLMEHGFFCGSAKSSNTIRLLPPLTIEKVQCEQLLQALTTTLEIRKKLS